MDQTPFLIIDYAPGGTLRQRHPKGALLPPDTVVTYITQRGHPYAIENHLA